MPDYNNPSGRRYPVVLKAFTQSAQGEILAELHEVFDDAEYDSFVKKHDRRNNVVKSFPSPQVLEEIRLEKIKQDYIDNLTREKLELDVKTGKRVYKTYPATQFFAWVGGITALLLALLKIAETFKIWPYAR